MQIGIYIDVHMDGDNRMRCNVHGRYEQSEPSVCKPVGVYLETLVEV